MKKTPVTIAAYIAGFAVGLIQWLLAAAIASALLLGAWYLLALVSPEAAEHVRNDELWRWGGMMFVAGVATESSRDKN